MNQHRCYGCMNLTTEEICPHCGHRVDQGNQPHQLPAGTVLKGQYLVGKALGQGGFGITYIGMDVNLELVVAIKEFYPASMVNRESRESLTVHLNTADAQKPYQDSKARFLREAQALAKMGDVPQIVDVRGFFEENNTAYIIMEYVRGEDLRGYVRRRGGRLEARELLPLLEPVLSALHSVHEKGLVHRDVSPDNIMILAGGGIKLLDFGAVRGVDSLDADVDLSHSTEAILKHGFAPMEQYRSRGNLGPWTDEYGICASVYYCLTGRVPPDAPARAMGEADVDWNAVPGLTVQQRQALEKGMSMRAKDRFGNLDALRRAIFYGEMEQIKAQEPEKKPEKPPVKKKKKGKGGLIAALVVLLLASAGGAWFLFGDQILASMQVPSAPAETQAATLPTETEPTLPYETVPPTTEPAVTEPEETEPPETVAVKVEAWEENYLKKDPLSELGLERSQIYEIKFLSTTETAPWNAVDVSYYGDGSVVAWKEWVTRVNVKVAHVYFAAEGGINGRYCCEGLFKSCINLEKLNLAGLHTDQAESMAYMFYDCYNLSESTFQQLKTGNVRDMSYMFAQHTGTSWGSLNLHYFDTANVENMSHMFAGREDTYSILVGNWDMGKVKDISAMFKDCKRLNSLAVENWNLGSLENMSEVFSGCQNMTSADVDRWDVSNVRDMSGAFFYCIFLDKLYVDRWDVSSVENMSNLFCGCIKLKTLAVENWDVSNVKDMTAMFSNCEALQQPDFSNWDVSNVTAYDRFLDGNAIINGNFWKYFFSQGK